MKHPHWAKSVLDTTYRLLKQKKDHHINKAPTEENDFPLVLFLPLAISCFYDQLYFLSIIQKPIGMVC